MSLPTTSPSVVGVDARAVSALLDAAAHLELHSIAIARDGRALARGWWAPYRAEGRQLLYSCSKSVTATTVAALAGDGVLDLDAPVLGLLPPAALVDRVDPRWQAVTLRHCLTMTLGHTADAWPGDLEAEPLHQLLGNPPTERPGSVFAYNQVATYLLSRVVEQATGRPLDQVARERVLQRIGIGDLDWERDPAGHPFGFTGVRLRTDDLLALGQLWLQRGTWGGDQVVPQQWFEQATVAALPGPVDAQPDWAGYGHSFWVARHGFRADGAFGQYCMVVPEQRLVVVITSEVEDMAEVVDLVWTHLLPGLDRVGDAAEAERADLELADAELAQRLEQLSLPATGSTAGPGPRRRWALEPGSSALARWTGVEVTADGRELVLLAEGRRVAVALGEGEWVDSVLVDGGRSLPVSASGGWTAAGFEAEVRVVETPHSFRFSAVGERAGLWWRMVPLRNTELFDQAVG